MHFIVTYFTALAVPRCTGHAERMRLDATPFVLIDAGPGRPGRLYRDPERVLAATTPGEVAGVLAAIAGQEAAGFLAYEAGATFLPRPLPAREAPLPLAWFGLFDRAEIVPDVAALLPDPAGARVARPEPAITRDAYDVAFAAVQGWITAGDIYQANLTFRARAPVLGGPLALYAAIRARAAAPHGALVWTGADWLLSFSPELFVSLDGERVTARPMKGTARRGATPEADRAAAAGLAADAKQRAENLMIVDLIRNDLTRVAEPGSVETPELFRVESYPTLHQLVSTVTARLTPGQGPADVIAAAFPCGSITGAPKQRAAEVIAAVEPDARGIYTGAIGWAGAEGAEFNVAIRTLHWRPGEPEATIGLGGGIVADSHAEAEWAEALAKGAFLTAGQRAVDLIETMPFDPVAGIIRVERHLARIKESAAALGRPFDRHGARNELQAATFRLRRPARIRLVLGESGAIAVEVSPLPPAPPVPVPVAVRPLPVDPADWRLRHKTSDRRFWAVARAAAGTWEVAFTDPDGFLTEGSFTSLFVPRGDRLLTPPLARSLLPGVLRAELIDEGRAEEADLTPADLAGGFLLGNGLRGLLPAVAVPGAAR